MKKEITQVELKEKDKKELAVSFYTYNAALELLLAVTRNTNNYSQEIYSMMYDKALENRIKFEEISEKIRFNYIELKYRNVGYSWEFDPSRECLIIYQNIEEE